MVSTLKVIAIIDPTKNNTTWLYLLYQPVHLSIVSSNQFSSLVLNFSKSAPDSIKRDFKNKAVSVFILTVSKALISVFCSWCIIAFTAGLPLSASIFMGIL